MAIITLVLAVVARRWPAGPLDVQVHDKYVVLTPSLVLLFISGFLALFSLIYYLVPPNPTAAAVHFSVTFVGLLGTCFSIWILRARIGQSPSSGVQPDMGAVMALAVSAVMVMISPALFAVNLVIAVSKRLRASS